LVAVRYKRALAVAAVAAALTGLAAGCGSGDESDLVNGKRLFTGEGRCGNCHVLARAGTRSSIGPSLDAAFGQSRSDGLSARTVAEVVYDQILNPRENSVMPKDLVTGQDARDVAAYVAQAAGGSGPDEGGVAERGAPDATAAEGRALFLGKGCGGCHILSDAKTGASVGPQLNDLRNAGTVKGQQLTDYLRQAILDPDANLVPGFPGKLMPSDYRKKLTDSELDSLIAYLVQVGGK